MNAFLGTDPSDRSHKPAELIDRIPDEVPAILKMNISDPGRFADLAATNLNFKVSDKDEILQLKSAVKRMQMGPTTTGGGFGGARKGSGQAIKSATDEAIQTKIVPVLHALLNEKDVSFHIQSAAELGLALAVGFGRLGSRLTVT